MRKIKRTVLFVRNKKYILNEGVANIFTIFRSVIFIEIVKNILLLLVFKNVITYFLISKNSAIQLCLKSITF